MYFLEDIVELGFTKEEISFIESLFISKLELEDWESMEFLEDEEPDNEQIVILPTGRIIYFPDGLMRKELWAQID
ncbi:hypothetical protein [Alkalibacillus salilacus]|uniref:Uncharacterized protein n=1 Tax=Alkalibacillus salilacus TaxID=284582 RepID=A0ABT9VDD4_9BACI|nr:hypothetical protein [Alkalibacillus salilacus]MDQ0158977.1 hypothetical protein [Alkalibacillus salilacus]